VRDKLKHVAMKEYGDGGLAPQISYIRLQINLLSNCSANKFRFASVVPACLNFATLQTYQVYVIFPSIVVTIHQLTVRFVSPAYISMSSPV